MQLPVMPPIKPMLARATTTVPEADGLLYEPKWDGYRCVVFRDGDEVELSSRGQKSLTRYFPELIDPRTGRSLMERTILIANTSNMR